MNKTQDRYLEKKLQDISASVAVVAGVANMVGVQYGKCTDGVIECRDIETERIIKIVKQLLKRYGK